MYILWQYHRIGAQLREHQQREPDLFIAAHHRDQDRDTVHRVLTHAATRPDHDDEAGVEPLIVRNAARRRDPDSSDDAATLHDDLGPDLDGIEARDRTTKEGKGERVFVVGWSENDPANPHSWSLTRRAVCTINVAFIAFTCLVSSSIDSAVAPQAAADFGVSAVVESLATGRQNKKTH